MISFVKGILESKNGKQAIVDVNGIGYIIEILPRTGRELPAAGSEVTFYTHYALREMNKTFEAKLYGFVSRDELKIFETALVVKGVGSGLAQNIVDRLSPAQFVSAVRNADHTTLMRVPRLNRELAQLITMKLKNAIKKVELDAAVEDGAMGEPVEEAVRALMGLEVTQEQAEGAVLEAQKVLGAQAKPPDIIRLALRYVNR
jgi:Holliday junction DNA helicase RuvA